MKNLKIKTSYKIVTTILFCLSLNLQSNAQSIHKIARFATAIKYFNEFTGINWPCLNGSFRYDYFWEMADGTIAVNRGVRCYRGSNYVFGSIFDQTSGDCDTEVYQNGQRYRNLCVGNAGGQGEAFVERHGGIVAFYRK